METAYVEVELRYTKPNESRSRPPAEYAIRWICIEICCWSLRLIHYLQTEVTLDQRPEVPDPHCNFERLAKAMYSILARSSYLSSSDMRHVIVIATGADVARLLRPFRKINRDNIRRPTVDRD